MKKSNNDVINIKEIITLLSFVTEILDTNFFTTTGKLQRSQDQFYACKKGCGKACSSRKVRFKCSLKCRLCNLIIYTAE